MLHRLQLKPSDSQPDYWYDEPAQTQRTDLGQTGTSRHQTVRRPAVRRSHEQHVGRQLVLGAEIQRMWRDLLLPHRPDHRLETRPALDGRSQHGDSKRYTEDRYS